MTLRTRLAWTYSIAIAFAVAIVAVVSYAAIDGTLRTSLNGRLVTTASTVAALVDVRGDTLVFDAEDREQMTSALVPDMSATIFNRDGTIFLRSAAPNPAVDEIARARSFPGSPVTVSDGSNRLRIVCRTIARGTTAHGHVCVWQSTGYIDDVDRSAIAAIALAALLAGGIAVISSTALAQRALAPLQTFSDLATEIEAYDLSRRLRHGGDDELGRLGSAFDRMLDRLESAFARQRRFTADASHELRAPLAVIHAEADAALAAARTADQYQETLHTIVSEVDRIDALVDALLLAARADSARLHFEPVDLAAMASMLAERFDGTATQRGISIEVIGDSRMVMADPGSLERAIAAILHNALDFARARVTLRAGSDAANASLTILDDGPGFSAEGLLSATQRFWRGEPRGRSGTGLGLAIADAIVLAHGGTLRLANRSDGGAAVSITLAASN